MREDLIPTTIEHKRARLIEEMGEVIKAFGKLDRFGEIATDHKTGITYDNVADLISELDDLQHALFEYRSCFL